MFISSTIPSIRLLPRLRGRGFPAEAGQDSESLTSLIERHDKRNANPNILLKIDIENDEWRVFDTTPLFQIVGESHYLQGFSDTHWRKFFDRVFKIYRSSMRSFMFTANDFGRISNVVHVIIPNTLEITFTNRSIYSFCQTDEVFPGPLDALNDPSCPGVFVSNDCITTRPCV